MVDEKFAKAGSSVWEHVVIGYSKCNNFETAAGDQGNTTQKTKHHK